MTKRLLSLNVSVSPMANPMDREFGEDDPFRRMERLKLARRLGVRCSEQDSANVETPICAEPSDDDRPEH